MSIGCRISEIKTLPVYIPGWHTTPTRALVGLSNVVWDFADTRSITYLPTFYKFIMLIISGKANAHHGTNNILYEQ